MKIKNITPGARGVHSIKGPVMIEPGAEVDVELSEAEEAVSRATGWFEFPTEKPKAAPKKAASEEKAEEKAAPWGKK